MGMFAFFYIYKCWKVYIWEAGDFAWIRHEKVCQLIFQTCSIIGTPRWHHHQPCGTNVEQQLKFQTLCNVLFNFSDWSACPFCRKHGDCEPSCRHSGYCLCHPCLQFRCRGGSSAFQQLYYRHCEMFCWFSTKAQQWLPSPNEACWLGFASVGVRWHAIMKSSAFLQLYSQTIKMGHLTTHTGWTEGSTHEVEFRKKKKKKTDYQKITEENNLLEATLA